MVKRRGGLTRFLMEVCDYTEPEALLRVELTFRTLENTDGANKGIV